MKPTALYVVVPIFNEVDNLERLVACFREIESIFAGEHDVRFVTVDDGSTDDSAAVVVRHATGLDLTVLSHGANKGPGRAFGTAFEHLNDRLRPQDWVATMEGDNTSRTETLRQMFQRTQEGYDVILASPYAYGGRITQTTLWRVILSTGANYFLREMLGLHGIFTMSSFYRLHRGQVLMDLQSRYGKRIIEHAGFESMVEMLIKMTSMKTTISEVPMILDTSRRAGTSKMKVFKTIVGYVSLWSHKRYWVENAEKKGDSEPS